MSRRLPSFRICLFPFAISQLLLPTLWYLFIENRAEASRAGYPNPAFPLLNIVVAESCDGGIKVAGKPGRLSLLCPAHSLIQIHHNFNHIHLII